MARDAPASRAWWSRRMGSSARNSTGRWRWWSRRLRESADARPALTTRQREPRGRHGPVELGKGIRAGIGNHADSQRLDVGMLLPPAFELLRDLDAYDVVLGNPVRVFRLRQQADRTQRQVMGVFSVLDQPRTQDDGR